MSTNNDGYESRMVKGTSKMNNMNQEREDIIIYIKRKTIFKMPGTNKIFQMKWRLKERSIQREEHLTFLYILLV